jgi:hypothetical protein
MNVMTQLRYGPWRPARYQSAGWRSQENRTMGQALTSERLEHQTLDYDGTGGTSADNRTLGFAPAFRDSGSGQVFLSCLADGSLAPVHMLDGLPDELVLSRDEQGRVTSVRDSVVPGFVRAGHFYTRDEAAGIVQRETHELPW